jgi:hypothetical protein
VSSELSALVGAIRGPLDTSARASAAADALVACGELEAALADAGHPSAALCALETDRLAAAVLGESLDLMSQAARLERIEVPHEIVTSTQEGFAFYALHPSSYARAAHDLGPCERALVVGVRTIGATLSAMVGAALRRRGVRTTRCTVRPEGHPYDRVLELDPAVEQEVTRARAERALVVVVDEGPGLSGSTFLAVAERLARAGIPDERLALIASTRFDPSRLAARDAESRYRRFRVIVAPVQADGPADGVSVSAGAWRAHAFTDESTWPSVFAQTERKKALVEGGTRLIKFEGLGPTGRAAAERARALYEAGFVAPGRDEGGGYLSYPWAGTPSTTADVGDDVLDRLASYCARRPILCPPCDTPLDLEAMVAKNLEVFGHRELALPGLVIVRAATVDGRMAPHEWLRQKNGTLLKCDAIAHGDDHFFPGPTDIAWDLAGAIVEWQLTKDAGAELLERYRRESSDDVGPRISTWIQAYATFRLALTTLALDQCSCPSERHRLARDIANYRTRLVGPPARVLHG